MNCRLTLLGLVSLSLAGLWSGPALADVRFERQVVDLGKIRGGPHLTYVVHFMNFGQQPVQIGETRASCTCLQPVVTPQIVRPGETGTLQLTVNTLSLTPGPHTWVARMPYRDPANNVGEASVQLTAIYTPEVSVTPSSVTFYTENGLTHDIVVTDVRPTPLKVLSIESSSPYLQAAVMKQSKNFRGHWVANIALQARRDMPPGRHEETISIYTDDQQYRQLTVNVSVVKKAAADQVTVHPNRVTLHANRTQPVASQLLRIHSSGTEPVNIRNITSDIPGFASRWAPGPGADATVRVLADGSRVRGEATGNILIEIDRPGHETLTVPVTVVVEQ